MTSLKDVIITMVLVVGYFLIFKKKKKNTKSSRPHSKPITTVAPEVIADPCSKKEDAAESFSSENEFFDEKDSKNAEYFTYETIAENESQYAESFESFPDEIVNNEEQTADAEKEDNFHIEFNSEELYKGVIYSEILKRPYNQ